MTDQEAETSRSVCCSSEHLAARGCAHRESHHGQPHLDVLHILQALARQEHSNAPPANHLPHSDRKTIRQIKGQLKEG